MTGTSGQPAAGGNRIGQALWMTWEGAIGRYMEWRSEEIFRFGICKVLVKRHRGRTIHCEDGTLIADGDWIGELHLNNKDVLELTRDGSSDRAALMAARRARDSMKQIQAAMETHPDLRRVKAVVGVTLLHRGLVHGLGFERQRLPSGLAERCCAVYLRLLLRCLHPEGRIRVAGQEEKLVPLRLVHTRESLRLRFGTKPQRAPHLDAAGADWAAANA
jgi:hypothetical protein